jgi:hypothetical protein
MLIAPDVATLILAAILTRKSRINTLSLLISVASASSPSTSMLSNSASIALIVSSDINILDGYALLTLSSIC